MRVRERVGGPLQAVGAGDPAPQALARSREVGRDPLAGAAREEHRPQRLDLDVAETHVGDQVPAARFAGRELEAREGEVGRPPALELRLGHQWLAAAKGRQRVGGQEHGRGRKAHEVDHRRLERLRRPRLVHDQGLQRDDAHGRPGVDLGPRVGVHQAAGALLLRHGGPGGHEIQQAVEDLQRRLRAPAVLHGHRAHEPEGRALRPAIAQREPQRVVLLLEGDLISFQRLGEVARDALAGRVAAKRLPEHRAGLAPDAQQRYRAGVPVAVVELVVGHVGEERPVGVDAPRRQAAPAGDVHPVIRVADHAHQERRHPVDFRDSVGRLAANQGRAVGRLL